jgi:hypothetical protein
MFKTSYNIKDLNVLSKSTLKITHNKFWTKNSKFA